MKIHYTIAFLICIFSFRPLIAQERKDAQIWENIEVEYPISKHWDFHINHEGRIVDNISNPNYGYLDGGATYSYNKHLKFTLDYVYGAKHTKTGDISNRHQLYFDVVVRKGFHGFMFYNRQMLQGEMDDIYSSEDGKIPVYMWRDKITVKYKKWGKYIPYVASELYYQFNLPQGHVFNRVRYFTGMFYSLNHDNQLEGYFMNENNFNVKHPQINYVYGIGYSHSIDW